MMHYLPFFFILFASTIIEAICGFGGTILALSFGSMFYDLNELLLLIIPLNLLLNFGMVVTNKHPEAFPYFSKKLLPAFLVGLVLGMAIVEWHPITRGKKYFAVIVILIVFLKTLRVSIPTFWSKYFLFLGGIIHAWYASSGPFVVMATRIEKVKKDLIRSSLPMLWFWMNLIFLISLLKKSLNISGDFEIQSHSLMVHLMVYLTGIFIVFMALKLGNHYSKNFSQVWFEKITLLLLLASSLIHLANG